MLLGTIKFMDEKTIEMKPIEKQSLSLKISDAIYKYIRLNDLKPGDKLPSERDMAGMLQTSRHSVREALRILEDRGLICVQTGRGVFLKEQYGEESTISIRLIGCSEREIQELQTTLDHQVVKNVISYASAEEKQELVDIAAEMLVLSESNTYSHTLDHSFHNKLYEYARNSATLQLINCIRNIHFIQQEGSPNGNDAIWIPTVSDHLSLAKSILAGDESSAVQCIDAINEYVFRFKNGTVSPFNS